MSTSHQRSRRKAPFWRRMVRQWRRSGRSVRAFCQEHGLAEPSFYFWRRTLAQRDAAAHPRAPAFLPVQLTTATPTPPTTATAAAAAPAPLELLLASGRQLRVGVGFDGPTLQRLLALLEEAQP